MSNLIIEKNLNERFSLPLKEFYNRRIIFWHDEEQEFIDLIDDINIENAKVIKVTGTNNFAIKKLLTLDDLESNYLVYNPISYANIEDNWLLDIELYSEDYRADDVSMKMDELHVANTPAMRKVMKIYKKFLENEKRRISLRKMGRDYNTPLQLHIDIMGVLCGLKSSSSQDLIIALLSNGLDKDNNECLANIKKFGNINAFWELVRKYTGYTASEDDTLTDFASHILLTALSQTISESELKGLERFISDTSKAYCYGLVKEWIDSENRANMLDVARVVEEELNLVNRFNKIEVETLAKADVFPGINEAILSRFFKEINQQVLRTDLILEINDKRRTTSWFELTSDYFDCLYNIAKIENYKRDNQKSFHIVEPNNICKFYTETAYKMDTYYRNFHLAFGNSLRNENLVLSDLLKQCTEYVEGVYQNWYLKELNDCWNNAISEDLGRLGYISELPKQRDFYSNFVQAGGNKNSKVFVIVSDAFRYEVAVELTEKLINETKGSATLNSMQSVFPSTTSFGMASLLPNKEISVNNNNLEVLVDGNSTLGLENRQKILREKNSKSVAIRYKDLLRMKGSERREITAGMEVVYIYHDAIDAIGDKAPTETKVFEACEVAIEEIINIVRMTTNDMNGTSVYITADHGFLYTYKPLLEMQKISKNTFNGEVYDIGRRYALTSEDTTAEYLTKIDLTNEIKGIRMSGYAPKDTIRIKKSGGGENFVHGGISIQEMIVPVISYKNLRTNSKKYIEVENAELTLLSESRKISNLIFSLEFLQKEPVGGKITATAYSLYFTDSEGIVISDKKTIIADKGSADISDRIFRERFNLKQMDFDRDKVYRLIIANDTDMPKEIEYEIDIAFATDFNFDFDL